ncbi:MAG: non-canonical purine NTP pyrophosphatase [Actinobacteria bacterium]|nr:non-canonical purine NTP pyrophosphatase [Actinomycetota bacterium]MBV8396690.1 non-canonical purine NTP pyrophosphatase [Actinomycetota bacterium]
MRALLASQNANKLAELRAMLPDWEIEPLVADDYPEETGASYEENARIKARFARTHADGVWAIGEDSGIEADALDGGPGLHSARWAAGDQADALLAALADTDVRGARMRTVIVAVSPAGDEVVAVGVLEGEIARERRGTTGFGYDPIFVPTGLTQTVAELGEEWKNVHSHRARAAQAFAAASARAMRS